MKLQSYRLTGTLEAIKYLLLVIIGILIILLSSLTQHVPAPVKGEYYYSGFFMHNYTLLAKALFVITAFAAGYIHQLNPWYTGLCLILIFPLTSIIEAIVYPGSHNLIPFEFAFDLWIALPSIIAAFIGRFIFRQVVKRKEKANDEVV